MEILLIVIISAAAAMLTFFSGFGLGTILMPVFALFFQLEIAIALTAIVHLLNNLFKGALVWKHIHLATVLLFGLPAMLAAFAGASLLNKLSHTDQLIAFQIFTFDFETSFIKLVIALLLILFALFELNKKLVKLTLSRKFLPLGGLLSGFFGGLSGHQGALRSVFLLKAGLSKEGFIATGIAIAICIDVARISKYGSSFLLEKLQSSADSNATLYVIVACLAAFSGSFIGRQFLKKVTLRNVKVMVSALLLIFAVLLGFGII